MCCRASAKNMMKYFLFVTALLLTIIAEIIANSAERKTRHNRNEDDGSTSNCMIDNAQFVKITSTLDNVMEKLNNLQGTSDSDMNIRMKQMEELIRTMTTDMLHMQTELYRVEEDALKKLYEIKEDVSGNRLYTTTKHDELRTEINANQENTNTKYRALEKAIEINKYIGSTTYIRWGRTTCPGNGSEIVYSGYAGGSRYNHSGAAASMICLPKDPEWAIHNEAANVYSGFVYGAEYEPADGPSPIDTFFGTDISNRDVPCVVCSVKTRSSSIMVPAKTSCQAGWTLEYTGYLMSGLYNHKAATDYYCVDAHSETLPAGVDNQDGYLLYFVEAICGSLRCPPYKNHWELACVVCSK